MADKTKRENIDSTKTVRACWESDINKSGRIEFDHYDHRGEYSHTSEAPTPWELK